MARLPLPLALIAAATVAACSSAPQTAQTGSPTSSAPQPVTQVHPYMAGNGVVQRVMPAPVIASTGSTAASTGAPLQRLEIRMDNGAIQYVDTPSTEITRGARVTLTPDHQIRLL